MIESMLQWDEQLFQLINGQWHVSWIDALMPYWRSKYFWVPAYLFLLAFLLANYGRRSVYIILSLLFIIFISDGISSQLIKKSVERVRPCNTPHMQVKLKLLVRCGSGYSFPSSHAANHFAIAIFLSLTLGRRFRWLSLPLILWAASIAFGQVYVGLHYPLDILGGALLGIAIGIIGALGYYQLSEMAIDFRATK